MKTFLGVDHIGLLAVYVDEIRGTTRLMSRVLEQLREALTLESLSSVYRISQAEHDNQFLVIAKFVTELSPVNLIDKIRGIEVSFCKIVLLAYEDEVSLLPELTLPHPTLVFDSRVLLSALEVWEQYRHPILETTLLEKAKEIQQRPLMEFMAQGRSISA